MANYTIEVVNELSKDVAEQMEKGFADYESQRGITVNYKKFSFILKETHGQAIGVLNAFTAFAEVYVDDMWVDQSFRGQGHGKTLLQALEKYFTGQGFNNINLVTNAFQAPEFYKKCGFTVEFIRENSQHPQLSKTFFIKYFEDEVQTQGLLFNEKP